jgi:dihydrofolate reductase
MMQSEPPPPKSHPTDVDSSPSRAFFTPPHPQPSLHLVVAMARNGTIGYRDTLPWRLSSDLQRFKRLTMGHALLMGRKTYESIGKPLPGRQTIVLSRHPNYRAEGARVVDSIDAALALLPDAILPFVVGGAEIYRLALPRMRSLHLTRVLADVPGDTRLDPFPLHGFQLVETETVPSDDRNDWPSLYEHWLRSD